MTQQNEQEQARTKPRYFIFDESRLRMLRELGMVPDYLYVYLASKIEQPFEVNKHGKQKRTRLKPKEFCSKWGLIDRSYRRVRKRLEELELWDVDDIEIDLLVRDPESRPNKVVAIRGEPSEAEADQSVRRQQNLTTEGSIDPSLVKSIQAQALKPSDSGSFSDQCFDKHLKPNQTREREISSKAVENSGILEQEKTFTSSEKAQPLETSSVKANTTQEDPSSAAPSIAQNFDYETFNWSEYKGAGDGGSDPRFWHHTWKNVQVVHDDLVAKGKPGVGDFHAFTLGCIRNQGLTRYKTYLISIGKLSPPASPEKSYRSTFQQSGQDSDPNPMRNGAGQQSEASIPFQPPEPEQLFAQRKAHLEALNANGEFRRMQEMLNAMLARDGAQVPPLLAHFPEWEIRRGKAWRATA